MAVVVVPFDGGVLDGAVHALDLTAPQENGPPDRFLIFAVPRVVRIGQPMLNAVRFTELEGTVAPVGPRKPRKRQTA